MTHDQSKPLFGFWLYLMTDCLLFACLFATFAVLRNNTFGGPAGSELFNLAFVLAETLILLTSSYTAGLGLLAAKHHLKRQTLVWFGATFLLGAIFLGMEIKEFHTLVEEGHSWKVSGFLSAFFTLVGTHGLHITSGLLWMGVLMMTIVKQGVTAINIKRLTMLSMFWHFLDVIWIFIFTVVYLFGAAQ